MVIVGLVVVAEDLLAHRPQLALSQQLLQVVRVPVAHAVPEVPHEAKQDIQHTYIPRHIYIHI